MSRERKIFSQILSSSAVRFSTTLPEATDSAIVREELGSYIRLEIIAYLLFYIGLEIILMPEVQGGVGDLHLFHQVYLLR